MGLLALPLNTNGDARQALGIAANQINRAYESIATAQNGLDYTTETNDLDIAQASVQGFYAMVPNDGAALAVTLIGQVSSALNRAQLALDEVASVTGLPGATWDFGDALTGLLHDTVDTATGLAGQAASGVASALTPLLWELGLAVGALVLLIVILKRSGATLGGLL